MQTTLFASAQAAAPPMSSPLPTPAAEHVGRAWDAKEGRRRIVRYHEPQGNFPGGAFEIATAGRSSFFHELVPPERLERLVFVDSSNHAGMLRAQEQQAEQVRAEEVEEGRYRGFLAALSPLKAGKARAALELVSGFNGRMQRRKDFIIDAVAQGATVGETRYGQSLLLPTGGYFTARQLTQTALDFAAHLRTA